MEQVDSSSTSRVTITSFDLKQQAKQPLRSLIPERWADQVRAINVSECKEAGLSLAQAFATDELAQYLLDSDDMAGLTPEQKWKVHVDLMTYIVAAHCYDGVVTTIGPDYEGVALWAPPGKDTEGWLTLFRSGMWRLYYQLSAGGKKRLYNELLPLLHDTKLEVLGPERDADCYYLVYLGTKPSGRGRGYARKLIEGMAARADAEGRAMYLESSSASNNAYYQKFGFEVVKDIYLGLNVDVGNEGHGHGHGHGQAKPPVKLSIMVREPQLKPRSAVVMKTVEIPIKLGAAFRMVG